MNRNLSAAALLAAIGATTLLIVYREAVWHWLVALLALRIGWEILRPSHVRRSAKKTSRLWEPLAALLGGFIVGNRRRGTHACGQCGHPIDAPSRAVYCSPACRNYAALERAETQRHAERMAAFGDVPEGFGEAA